MTSARPSSPLKQPRRKVDSWTLAPGINGYDFAHRETEPIKKAWIQIVLSDQDRHYVFGTNAVLLLFAALITFGVFGPRAWINGVLSCVFAILPGFVRAAFPAV